jgi:hypothetical protein
MYVDSIRVADPYHFNAHPDADPCFHFNADPDPSFHFNADPDPAFYFNADTDPVPHLVDGNLQPLVHGPCRAPF